jgi:hypothetical protein
MSYALFWIETAVVLLLWVAFITAVAGSIRRRFYRGLIILAAILFPAAALSLLAVFTAHLKFGLSLTRNWFVYTTALLTVFVISALVIVIWGSRRDEAGRRSETWPRWRLAGALGVAIAVAVMTLCNMDLAVRSEAGAMRIEAGALLMSVSPANVPDSQNAALLYEKAFALMDRAHQAHLDAPMTQESEPDPNSPQTQAYLARQAPALKLLRAAAQLPGCRFEHDYSRPSIQMMLPELAKMRNAARLLQLDARSQLARDHVPEAVQDVNAIFGMSRDLGGPPLILTALVAFGIESLAVQTFEETLAKVSQPGELDGLNLGDPSAEKRLFQQCLAGEEAFGLAIFADLATDRLTLAALQPVGGLHAYGEPNEATIPDYPILLRVFLMPDDLQAYRELMNAYRAAAAAPDPVRPPADLVKMSRGGLLTSLIVPNLDRHLQIAAEAEARLADAQIGLAATRYRLDQGAFPATIAELVPQYLDDVPLDPFDGNPMRMIVHPRECLIYSIGPDLKDDGGKPFDRKTKTGDILFVLKEPQMTSAGGKL